MNKLQRISKVLGYDLEMHDNGYFLQSDELVKLDRHINNNAPTNQLSTDSNPINSDFHLRSSINQLRQQMNDLKKVVEHNTQAVKVNAQLIEQNKKNLDQLKEEPTDTGDYLTDFNQRLARQAKAKLFQG